MLGQATGLLCRLLPYGAAVSSAASCWDQWPRSNWPLKRAKRTILSTGPSLRTRVLVGYPCGHHQATALGRGWMVKGCCKALRFAWRGDFTVLRICWHFPLNWVEESVNYFKPLCLTHTFTFLGTHFCPSPPWPGVFVWTWAGSELRSTHATAPHTQLSITAVGSLSHPHSCPDRAPVPHQYPLLHYTLMFRNPFLESLRMQ